MNNDNEVERMAKAVGITREEWGEVAYEPYNQIFEACVNAGIGDKKQAVKEFVKRALAECESVAVYAEWSDEHGEYGGDMVGIGSIETIFDTLITELYGVDITGES